MMPESPFDSWAESLQTADGPEYETRHPVLWWTIGAAMFAGLGALIVWRVM